MAKGINIIITGDSAQFQQALLASGSSFKAFSTQLANQARTLNTQLQFTPSFGPGFGTALAALAPGKIIAALAGIRGIALGIRELAVNIPTANAELDEIKLRLSSLSDSQASSGESFRFLTAESLRTNRALDTLRTSYAKLLPLSSSSLLTTDQQRSVLQGYQDVAARTGATNLQLAQSLFGVTQGLSTGVLRAEELNQTVEPLPGLLQALDAAAGLPAGGFRKLVNAGEVTAQMFRDVLIKAFKEYEGAAESAAGNTRQVFQAFSNELRRFREDNETVTAAIETIVTAGTKVLAFFNGMERRQLATAQATRETTQALQDYIAEIQNIDLSALPEEVQFRIRTLGIQDAAADIRAISTDIERLQRLGVLSQKTLDASIGPPRNLIERSRQLVQEIENVQASITETIEKEAKAREAIVVRGEAVQTRARLRELHQAIGALETENDRYLRSVEQIQRDEIRVRQNTANKIADLQQERRTPTGQALGRTLELLTLETKQQQLLAQAVRARIAGEKELAAATGASAEERVALLQAIESRITLLFDQTEQLQQRRDSLVADLPAGSAGTEAAIRASGAAALRTLDAQKIAAQELARIRKGELTALREQEGTLEQTLTTIEERLRELTEAKAVKLSLDVDELELQRERLLRQLDELSRERLVSFELSGSLAADLEGQLAAAELVLAQSQVPKVVSRLASPDVSLAGEKQAAARAVQDFLTSVVNQVSDELPFLQARLAALEAIDLDVDVLPNASSGDFRHALGQLLTVLDDERGGFALLPEDLIPPERIDEATARAQALVDRLSQILSNPDIDFRTVRESLTAEFEDVRAILRSVKADASIELQIRQRRALAQLGVVNGVLQEVGNTVGQLSEEQLIALRVQFDKQEAVGELEQLRSRARQLQRDFAKLKVTPTTAPLLADVQAFVQATREAVEKDQIQVDADLQPFRDRFIELREAVNREPLRLRTELSEGKTRTDAQALRTDLEGSVGAPIEPGVQPQVTGVEDAQRALEPLAAPLVVPAAVDVAALVAQREEVRRALDQVIGGSAVVSVEVVQDAAGQGVQFTTELADTINTSLERTRRGISIGIGGLFSKVFRAFDPREDVRAQLGRVTESVRTEFEVLQKNLASLAEVDLRIKVPDTAGEGGLQSALLDLEQQRRLLSDFFANADPALGDFSGAIAQVAQVEDRIRGLFARFRTLIADPSVSLADVRAEIVSTIQTIQAPLEELRRTAALRISLALGDSERKVEVLKTALGEVDNNVNELTRARVLEIETSVNTTPLEGRLREVLGLSRDLVGTLANIPVNAETAPLLRDVLEFSAALKRAAQIGSIRTEADLEPFEEQLRAFQTRVLTQLAPVIPVTTDMTPAEKNVEGFIDQVARQLGEAVPVEIIPQASDTETRVARAKIEADLRGIVVPARVDPETAPIKDNITTLAKQNRDELGRKIVVDVEPQVDPAAAEKAAADVASAVKGAVEDRPAAVLPIAEDAPDSIARLTSIREATRSLVDQLEEIDKVSAAHLGERLGVLQGEIDRLIADPRVLEMDIDFGRLEGTLKVFQDTIGDRIKSNITVTGAAAAKAEVKQVDTALISVERRKPPDLTPLGRSAAGAAAQVQQLRVGIDTLRQSLQEAGGEEFRGIIENLGKLDERLKAFVQQPAKLTVVTDVARFQTELDFLVTAAARTLQLKAKASVSLDQESMDQVKAQLAAVPPVSFRGDTTALDAAISRMLRRIAALKAAAASVSLGAGGGAGTGFATGGRVFGPAGYDQVEARLTAGEYVITESGSNIADAIRFALGRNPALMVEVRRAISDRPQWLPLSTQRAGIVQQFASGGAVRPVSGSGSRDAITVNLMVGKRGPYTGTFDRGIATRLVRDLRGDLR